jgi:hypothetical protein
MTVQPADVRDVLGATELSDTQLSALIEPAGRIYDPLIDDEAVPDGVRDDVVTQLAAHLVAMGPERQLSSADGISWEGDIGQGLDGSTHGQLAQTLDPTGALSTRDLPTPSIHVPDAK